MSNSGGREYVPWDPDKVELVPPYESEHIQEIIERVTETQLQFYIEKWSLL